MSFDFRERPDPAAGNQIEDLVTLFYEAIFDAKLWGESVRQIAERFGGAVTSLSCFRGTNGSSLTGSGDPAYFRLYNEHYGALDPHAARLPANPQPGPLGIAEELLPLVELERTTYYNEFMKPLGMYYGLGGILRSDENGVEVMSMFRSKDRGPISTDELRILNDLSNHLRRARTVFHRVESLTEHAGVLKGSVDALRCAVVICDARGRVVMANAVAARQLERGSVLSISAGGDLAITGGVAGKRLRRALGGAAAGKPGCIAIPMAWPLPPLILNLAPLPHQGAVKRILVAWEPGRSSDTGGVQPEVLANALGLTPGEARVALLVADGLETSTIAEQLQVRPNTVRVHLKRTYAKTGVRGRADLARLVLRVVSSVKVLRATL